MDPCKRTHSFGGTFLSVLALMALAIPTLLGVGVQKEFAPIDDLLQFISETFDQSEIEKPFRFAGGVQEYQSRIESADDDDSSSCLIGLDCDDSNVCTDESCSTGTATTEPVSSFQYQYLSGVPVGNVFEVTSDVLLTSYSMVLEVFLGGIYSIVVHESATLTGTYHPIYNRGDYPLVSMVGPDWVVFDGFQIPLRAGRFYVVSIYDETGWGFLGINMGVTTDSDPLSFGNRVGFVSPGSGYPQSFQAHSLPQVLGIQAEITTISPGACGYTDNTAPCDMDGVSCTDDVCSTGACVAGPPSDDLCDNDDWCDGGETCDPINDCQPGTPPVCDDGVDCTDDACDEVNDQCVSYTNDSNCDDGLFCTGTETCEAVNGCQAGTAPDCDDGVGCTNDSCDEAGNQCVNDIDDSNCDDGLWCTGTETCDVTNDCQAGVAPDCDDGVDCTNDSCDEAGDQCVNETDDSYCYDGMWCNGIEICDAVNGCGPGVAPDCDDGVGCTEDFCDETNDRCFHNTNDDSCDDGLWCTGVETCDAGNDCQAGSAPDCDDGVGCTNDSCEAEGDQCVNDIDDSNCDDGLFCNGAETCDVVDDCQEGTPFLCEDDGEFCNGDEYCDEIIQDCAGAGDPCQDEEVCDEDQDSCVPEATDDDDFFDNRDEDDPVQGRRESDTSGSGGCGC